MLAGCRLSVGQPSAPMARLYPSISSLCFTALWCREQRGCRFALSKNKRTLPRCGRTWSTQTARVVIPEAAHIRQLGSASRTCALSTRHSLVEYRCCHRDMRDPRPNVSGRQGNGGRHHACLAPPCPCQALSLRSPDLHCLPRQAETMRDLTRPCLPCLQRQRRPSLPCRALPALPCRHLTSLAPPRLP